MIYKGTEHNGDFTCLFYEFGRKYGYQEALRFLDRIISEGMTSSSSILYQQNIGDGWTDVTVAVNKESGYLQAAGPLMGEKAAVALAGTYHDINARMMVVMHPQTSILQFTIPNPEYQFLTQTDIDSFADLLEPLMNK